MEMGSKVSKLKKTFSMDKDVADKLDELSKETLIPQSKLLDKALKDLFKAYGKDTE